MRSPRRRAREFALQGLYQWQVAGHGTADIAAHLAGLEGYGAADEPFLKAELAGVIEEAEGLRALLEPLVDRKWAEVSPVEKAILYLGAWELAHVPEMPYRVAINEAIELAKRFGGADGHKYVNGILDRLAESLRPGEVADSRARPPVPRRSSRAPSRKKAAA